MHGTRCEQLRKVAHKQTETQQQMQPCNLLPTQTDLESARTHPHTGDTQDVWSPKQSSQGPFLKAVSTATD